MFKVKLEGLENLQRQLNRLQRNAEALNGAHQVPLKELFPPAFMTQHTKYPSIDAMFESSPFAIKSQEDLESISIEHLDEFVGKNTNFKNWEEMKKAAEEAYITSRLFS